MAFGFVSSFDAQLQGDPWPNAGVGLLSSAVEGTRDGASLFIDLGDGSTVQHSPTFSIDSGLHSGRFEGDGVAGSFQCGEYQDPSAPRVGG